MPSPGSAYAGRAVPAGPTRAEEREMLFRRGVRLGRVLGVEIALDPSWFVFAVLIAWLLGQGFATGVSRISGGAAAALGVMGAALFFASVLAHELSHAVVARRKGIPVHRITLFIFGGMAQISREPRTPGDEVKIALAGPALSSCLGALLLALGLAADALGASAGAALLETVGVVNVLLAVFNLLPGFPLDGGRVFRAVVWRVTGDQARATRVAATSGRIVGGGLMAIGASLAFLRHEPLNGIWLVLIGLFLYQAALAAYRQAGRGAPSVTVGDVMTRQPEWLPTDLPVDRSLRARILGARDRAFPVVDPWGRIVGVVTLEALDALPGEPSAGTTVAQVMVPMQPAMVADPREPYDAVMARLAFNPTGRFLVLEEGRLVGMLSPRELSGHPALPATATREA